MATARSSWPSTARPHTRATTGRRRPTRRASATSSSSSTTSRPPSPACERMAASWSASWRTTGTATGSATCAARRGSSSSWRRRSADGWPTVRSAARRPPDHANRGNRAQVLDEHLVHGELGQPDPLAQPVRQVASSAGLRVASVPEEIERSIGGEMPPDDPQRLLRLKPEGHDVEGEDLVESLVPEVRLLERDRLQHGPASCDVLAIPTRGHLSHLLRAIDRGDPSAGQPLADQRYGHAVSAANLQHAIGWGERQGLHRPHEPLRGLARHADALPSPPATVSQAAASASCIDAAN